MNVTADTEFYMPVDCALDELRRRRRDRALVQHVTSFLGGDIPQYLLDDECFVLPRHIATPNFETLYVLKQAEEYGTLAVFSQDLDDVSTSVNDLKRRLARPEICLDNSQGRFYRKIDLVNIPEAEGRKLKEICTRSGRPLAQFHNTLFSLLGGPKYFIVDDSKWIDRNARGNLSRHYMRFLALFVTHGVLFDYFHSKEDKILNARYVTPAVLRLQHIFGCSPIISRPFMRIDARKDLAHDALLFTAFKANLPT